MHARKFDTFARFALNDLLKRPPPPTGFLPYARLSKAIGVVLEQMRELDTNHFFSSPPYVHLFPPGLTNYRVSSRTDLPGYELFILHPMDLSTISTKVQRRLYETSDKSLSIISLAEASEVARR